LERPGADQHLPRYLTNVAGDLYFVDGGNDLWKVSKSGAAGKLREFEAGIDAGPARLTSVGSTLYFIAELYPGRGVELWRSDGTPAGTKMVREIDPYAGSQVRNLVNVDGRLYFSADDGMHGAELWLVPTDADTAARGDFDQNGATDGADFLKWQRTFGSANPTSDGDGDGVVGGGDLDVWRERFGSPESAAQQNGTVAAVALVAEEEDTAAAGLAAASRAMEDATEPSQRARDALFAAGDFSRLFGPGGDGEFENSLRRRGRVSLARRG
jgi:ELWxxDGT repeat protein